MQEFIERPVSKNSLAKRKPLFGVGINDADYVVLPRINGKRVMCPYYQAWSSMIGRSYSEKFQDRHNTYIDCSVVKEWLNFSSFRKWMEKQDWQGRQLDKDLLIPENKEYGPDTCIFVSSQINTMLTDRAADRGDLPQGVSFHKQRGRYRAQCAVSGKNKHLGLFSTIPAAEYKYLKFKSDLIKKTAYEPESASNQRLQTALLAHSNLFAIRALEINRKINLRHGSVIDSL